MIGRRVMAMIPSWQIFVEMNDKSLSDWEYILVFSEICSYFFSSVFNSHYRFSTLSFYKS